MKTVPEIFAKNLRDIRESKGLSQEKLGALAQISDQSVAAYEKMKRWPDRAQVTALASALKVSEGALFAEKLPPTLVPKSSLQRLLFALSTLDDEQVLYYASLIEAEVAGAQGEPLPEPPNTSAKPRKPSRGTG